MSYQTPLNGAAPDAYGALPAGYLLSGEEIADVRPTATMVCPSFSSMHGPASLID